MGSTALGRTFGPDALRRVFERAPVGTVLVGVVLYSTNAVLVRWSGLDGLVFAFWRILLAVPLLWVAVALGRDAGLALPSRRDLRPLVAAGLCLGVNIVTFMSAVQMMSVAEATLIGALTPVLTGGWGAVGGERLGTRFWAWASLAVGGAGLVSAGSLTGARPEPVGLLLALTSVVAFAAFLVTTKAARRTTAPVPLLFWTTVFSAVPPVALVAVSGASVAVTTAHDWLCIAGVLFGAGTLGHLLFTAPLRVLPASVPAVAKLAQPLLAVALAWLLLGEAPTRVQVLGGSLAVLGVAGAVLRPRQPDLPASSERPLSEPSAAPRPGAAPAPGGPRRTPR